ncbi:MAG: hypothetical protein ACRDRM_05020, partial [Pseudonocardiaceae bacterium]
MGGNVGAHPHRYDPLACRAPRPAVVDKRGVTGAGGVRLGGQLTTRFGVRGGAQLAEPANAAAEQGIRPVDHAHALRGERGGELVAQPGLLPVVAELLRDVVELLRPGARRRGQPLDRRRVVRELGHDGALGEV